MKNTNLPSINNIRLLEDCIMLLLKDRSLPTITLAFILGVDAKYLDKRMAKLKKWNEIQRTTWLEVSYWKIINRNYRFSYSEKEMFSFIMKRFPLLISNNYRLRVVTK